MIQSEQMSHSATALRDYRRKQAMIMERLLQLGWTASRIHDAKIYMTFCNTIAELDTALALFELLPELPRLPRLGITMYLRDLAGIPLGRANAFVNAFDLGVAP